MLIVARGLQCILLQPGLSHIRVWACQVRVLNFLDMWYAMYAQFPLFLRVLKFDLYRKALDLFCENVLEACTLVLRGSGFVFAQSAGECTQFESQNGNGCFE